MLGSIGDDRWREYACEDEDADSHEHEHESG